MKMIKSPLYFLFALLAISYTSFASADDAQLALPYCDVSNPHTPPPSNDLAFFLGRNTTGNLSTQWCNEYNLLKNKPWATRTDNAVKLNKSQSWNVVKFMVINQETSTLKAMKKAIKLKDSSSQPGLILTHFARCPVIVKSPTSWEVGKNCDLMTDKEGKAYLHRFGEKTATKK